MDYSIYIEGKLRDKKNTWTDKQQEAIDSKYNKTYVSAAAGSGKTAVLTNRIIENICNNGLDIDRVLVATFTKAAARDLKKKIEKGIRKAIADNNKKSADLKINNHLKSQLNKIGASNISTYDTFFYSLVSENYSKLHLPSNFGIIEGEEENELIVSIIQSIKEEYIRGKRVFKDCNDKETKEKITELVYILGEPSNDKVFSNSILSLYYNVKGGINYEKRIFADLYSKKVEEYEKENYEWYRDLTFEDTPWFSYLKTFFENMKKSSEEYLEKYYELCKEVSISCDKLQLYLNSYIQYFDDLAKASTIIEMKEKIGISISIPKKLNDINPVFQDLKDSYSEDVLGASEDFYKKIKKLILSEEDLDESVQKNYEYLDALSQFISTIDKAILEEKTKRKQFGFSDITLFMYKLLTDENGEPSSYCRDLASNFSEIYLDEYQDTNEIQNRIFDLLQESNKDIKVFIVGDIKQCIYAFRDSEPDLFDKKINSANGIESANIKLSANFRSYKEVIDSTNSVFDALSKTCQTFPYEDDDKLIHQREEYFNYIDVEKDAVSINEHDIEKIIVFYRDEKTDEKDVQNLLLKFGITKFDNIFYIKDESYKELLSEHKARKNRIKSNGNEKSFKDYILSSNDSFIQDLFDPKVEILLCDTKSKEIDVETHEEDRCVNVFTLLAERIIELKEKGYNYSDIAILVKDRSKYEDVTKELLQYNIPNIKDSVKGFFKNPEIQFVINLLYATENVLYDTYVSGSANGPMYNISLSEMIHIKNVCPKDSIYESFLSYLECEEDDKVLKDKIKKYISDLDDFKNTYATQGCTKLVDSIYKKTWIIPIMMVSGDPKFKEIKNNLDIFKKFVAKFEQKERRTLVELLTKIELINQGDSKTDIDNISNYVDAITMSTLHSSKGLEYPCVFLINIEKSLIKSSSDTKYNYTKGLPITLPLLSYRENSKLPPKRKKTYLDLITTYCKNDLQLDEAARLLYVGMTRAQNKLIMIGDKGGIKKAYPKSDIPLTNITRYHYAYYLYWILLSLKKSENNVKIFDYVGNDCEDIAEGKIRFDFSILDDFAKKSEAEDVIKKEEELKYAKELRNEEEYKNAKSIIESRMNFEYPYMDDINIQNKLYASMIYPGILDYDSETPEDVKSKIEYFSNSQPRFIREMPKYRRASDAGTIVHNFMAFVDFNNVDNKSIDDEIDRIEKEEYMESVDVDYIRNEKIKKAISTFFKSSIASRIRHADVVWREVRFISTFPASYFTLKDERQKRFINRDIIVQGQMDVIFKEKDGKWILLDYKTDYSGRNYENIDKEWAIKEMINRHALQLSIYKEAAEKLYGIEVDQTLLYSFAIGDTIELPKERLNVKDNLEKHYEREETTN